MKSGKDNMLDRIVVIKTVDINQYLAVYIMMTPITQFTV